MWDKTLKKVNHSITPQKAAALWDADINSIKLVNDGINLVYRFEVQKQGRYLRITHREIRDYDELVAAIDFQKYLHNQDVPICNPIPSKLGHFIEEVNQNDLTFLVHVTQEVPGKIMNFEYNDAYIYKLWGASLAKLHQAAKNYQSNNKFKFKNWKDLWQEIAKYLPGEDAIIKKEYEAISSWFATMPESPSIFGLTHGDHMTNNVLYDGKQIYFIDFDEPVYHWFLADIAKPFLELCEKPFFEWKQKFEWYIEGYKSVLPISDDQIKNIHWFVKMKSLDIYLWCKNNWKDPIAPGGKSTEKWLNNLRSMILNPIFLNAAIRKQ